MIWWRRDFLTRQAFLNLRFKNLLFILLFATADSSLFGPSHLPRRYFSRRPSQVQTGARPAPLTCKCFPLCFETTGIESLPNATEILPGVASSQLRLSETWRLARINRCKSKQAQTVRATHKSSLSASESPRRPAWKSAVEPTALTTTFAHRGNKVHPEQTHTKTEPRSHTQRRPAHTTTQYDSLRTASPKTANIYTEIIRGLVIYGAFRGPPRNEHRLRAGLRRLLARLRVVNSTGTPKSGRVRDPGATLRSRDSDVTIRSLLNITGTRLRVAWRGGASRAFLEAQ
uniref:Putative secreted protein n=1 Tax=Ixodes ricinus TaxID=34613 RepID=A0A6B0V772_IXORI